MTKGAFRLPIMGAVDTGHIEVSWDNGHTNPVMFAVGSFKDYFKKVRLVTLADNGHVNSVLADYDNPEISGSTDGTDGQVMAELPALYYKVDLDGDDHLEGFGLSETPRTGYTLHPHFSWGDGRDKTYIGAYEASLESGTPDKLASVSGAAVHANITMAAFRDLAVARGGGTQATSPWHIMGFWEQHLIALLFYAYYKTRDSQAVLPGYTERSSWADAARRTTGRSNILEGMNGSVYYDPTSLDSDLGTSGWDSTERYIANRFLWIENIFGHIWKFNDGVTYVPTYMGSGITDWTGDYQAVYATADIRDFSSVQAEILADYTKLSAVPYSSGNSSYPNKNMGDGMVPTEHGGITSQYWCSESWLYLADTGRNYLRVVLAGGSLRTGANAGVACRASSHSFSFSHAPYGARLAFSKI